ncbi:MAG: hypothetical protein ACLFR2_12460 [Candidatus Kapaibacterium sp.]
MEIKEFTEKLKEESAEKGYLTFSEEEWNNFTQEEAQLLAAQFRHNTLLRLPESEIKFFEWLKKQDKTVWHDLWGNVEEKPYLVGMSFLPVLINSEGRGFPICDLEGIANYFFSTAHMVDEESKVMIETAQKRFMENKELTTAQLLALEISIGPIDIWHFAYKHNIDLNNAKKAVKELVEDKALVHLTDAAHLAGFVNF